jgi:hypothetical protein
VSPPHMLVFNWRMFKRMPKRGDHYLSFEVKNFQFSLVLINYYVSAVSFLWFLVNYQSDGMWKGGRLVASGRKLGETTNNMLLIIVQRTWCEKYILWNIFMFIYFRYRFRFDYLKSFWKLFRQFATLSTIQVWLHNIFFVSLKNCTRSTHLFFYKLCYLHLFASCVLIYIMRKRGVLQLALQFNFEL